MAKRNEVETNKGLIKISKKSYGWIVAEGKFRGIGSHPTKEALIEATNQIPAGSARISCNI